MFPDTFVIIAVLDMLLYKLPVYNIIVCVHQLIRTNGINKLLISTYLELKYIAHVSSWMCWDVHPLVSIHSYSSLSVQIKLVNIVILDKL